MKQRLFYVNRISEDLGGRIAGYSPAILQRFPDPTKTALAKTAIKRGDYDGLKHILPYIKYPVLLVEEAISHRLDIEAVKILSAHKAFAYDLSFRPDLFPQLLNIKSFAFAYEEQEQRKTEIFKILMNAQIIFTSEALTLFATRISQEEFDKFCQDKKIDLADYAELDLSHYASHQAVRTLKPIYDISTNPIPTLIDTILSRTFCTEGATEKQFRAAYQKILDADPIAKQMLVYLALQIAKGNTIKLIFDPNTDSRYTMLSNTIDIQTSFYSFLDRDRTRDVDNIEADIIHEVGHFFYYCLFNHEAMPFNAASLMDKLSISFIKTIKNDEFISEDHIWFYAQDRDNIAQFIERYESAAKQPIYKAAELLRFDTTRLDKYKLTEEYTEFFKQKSVIDVFYLNAAVASSSTPQESQIQSALPASASSVIKSLQDIYIAFGAEKGTSVNFAMLHNTFLQSPEKQLVDWALETFLPQVIQELALTPKQVHFLERIADYINRGEHMYSPESTNPNTHEQYAELIVRYPELKVTDMDPELLASFDGLVAWHNEYASPLVEQEIAKYKESCMNTDHTASHDNAICIVDL